MIPYKAAGDHASASAVVLAMLISAAILNTLLSLRAERTFRLSRTEWILACSMGVLTVVGNYCSQAAVQEIGPGLTAVLQQTQVLTVTGLAVLLLGERITGRFFLGVALALGGFAIMRIPTLEGTDSSLYGMLVAVGSAVAFAIMHVMTRKVIDDIRPVPVNSVRLWLAAALLALSPESRDGVVAMSGTGWLLCASAAFVGPFLARISVMYAVRHVPASRSALYTLSMPLFAYVLAAIVFGTIPTWLEVIGGVVLVSGVFLSLVEHLGQESDSRPATATR